MYVIVKTRYFYGPNEARTVMEDDNTGRTLKFGTAYKARKYIKGLEESVYYLAHGEYQAPTYMVRRIDYLPRYLANTVI